MAGSTRWVVVGYGMGAYHSRLIKEVDGLDLLGVCDQDPVKREQALRDSPAIRTYSTFDEVLADKDCDGIVAVTPHNLHCEMAVAGMQAGKHTITDKAMCLTVAEAEKMISARDKAGVLLSVFHNRRWDSDFLTVRRLVEEGTLGRLHHIDSCVTDYAELQGWRTERASMGGWLFDWGAHTIDQILILAKSKAKHVYAFAHHRFTDRKSVEDYVNLTITFESGLTATTVVSYLHRIRAPRWHVIGDGVTLRSEGFETPAVLKHMIAGQVAETTVPQVKGDWKSFYQNIADHLAGRAELEVKPEQLVPQIAIAQAAYRSIETEQVIKLA